MNSKPIKRHKAIQSISREHYQGLLFCSKIRMGLKKQIEPLRMAKYAKWFYAEHLIPHFEIEEKYLFPVLTPENEMIQKAIKEHRMLTDLCKAEAELATNSNLVLLEKTLEAHIRFEERVLFKEIESIATSDQLELINKQHKEEKFVDNLADQFWK